MSEVAIIGAGGHALVVLDALNLGSSKSGNKMIGWIVSDVTQAGSIIYSFRVLGGDDQLSNLRSSQVIDSFVVGVGMIEGGKALRPSLFQAGLDAGLSAAKILHPGAIIAQSAKIGGGSVVMAGAIINPGVVIGRNVIINTGAVIEHDCVIGDHVHIAPRAVLSGKVRVGENTIIGVGATCLQGVVIGQDATVGAGSVVLREVEDGMRVAGNPAKQIYPQDSK